MDTYTIKKEYPWTKQNELMIESENLHYSELRILDNGQTLSGVHCNSEKNYKEIHKTCVSIANLVRKLEELNKS